MISHIPKFHPRIFRPTDTWPFILTPRDVSPRPSTDPTPENCGLSATGSGLVAPVEVPSMGDFWMKTCGKSMGSLSPCT